MAYSAVIEKQDLCLIQAILVISMCYTGMVHSSPGRPVPLADPKIVILGATGEEKRSVANVLLGESPDCKNCTFPVYDGSASCTNHTKYAEGKWLGLDTSFTIVDTPGFGDSEGRDDQFIDEMVDVLVHHVNTTNVFLLTFNGEDPRMDGIIKQMIREMEMLFGYKFWDNVILEATHWAYSENEIRHRNLTGKNEEWWTKDKNEALRKEYHLDHDLDAVFIDSWAKQDVNIPDTSQKEAFDRETGKLWKYAMNNSPFAFRTIEDVLADLDEGQRTLEGDIAELKAEMEEAKKNFTEIEASLEKETLERQENDSALQMSVTARLDQESLERQENDSALQMKVTARLDQETLERQENDSALQMNVFARLNQETLERQENDSALKQSVTDEINEESRVRFEKDMSIDEQLYLEISERKTNDDELGAEIARNVTVLNESITEVQDAVDHLHISPLGSIIAWVTKPEEAAKNEITSIPAGWVLCDGRPIPEPSIWAGSHTPNLNEGKRFLRGGDFSSQLTMEDDMVQDHMHKEGVHSHATTAKAEFGIEIWDDYRLSYSNPHDHCSLWCAYVDGVGGIQSKKTTVHPNVNVDLTNAKATCGTKEVDTDDTGYRAGGETRPVNMNVQWIMRVF